MKLIFSLVARGATTLAEYTEYDGNFDKIAAEQLSKAPPDRSRFIFLCEGHRFNYLRENGYTYLLVCDEETDKSLPFAFLDRVREDFEKLFGHTARTAPEHSLNRAYGRKLREHMDYVSKNPGSVSRIAGISQKVIDVKSQMEDNIQRAVERHVSIDEVMKQTQGLRAEAREYYEEADEYEDQIWWQMHKMKVWIGSAIAGVVLLAIIALLCVYFLQPGPIIIPPLEVQQGNPVAVSPIERVATLPHETGSPAAQTYQTTTQLAVALVTREQAGLGSAESDSHMQPKSQGKDIAMPLHSSRLAGAS